MTLKFDEWPKKTIRHLFYTTSNFVRHFKSIGEFKLELKSLEKLNSSKNLRFFVLHDLEIWWMTLKNNRAPLLYYIKLCAAFQSHWHILTGVTVRKRSIRVKIGDFLSRVTLKIDVWSWKTIGHLFYTTSSFVHCFKSLVKSNLGYSLETLKSGKNWRFFLSCVTLKIDVWTIVHLFYAASTFVHHFIANDEFKLE